MQHDLEHSPPVMSQQNLYAFNSLVPNTPGYFSQVIEAVGVMDEEVYARIAVEQQDELLLAEHDISPFYLFLRRAIDLTFALCGIVIMLLIFPILAPLIYLDSQGPIFYSQERLGYLGKTFRILKFRSMHVDAEAAGHAVWAAEHDERVTRVGRFMRAIHLDELPQVINILRGEMSLIGPRPEREEFVTELEKTIPLYRHRLGVKPGLTGWAQVKYRYTRTDEEALIKLQYDLYYIKRRSFRLDLLIILKTVVEVLSYHGT
ncbi:MAG: hypothetical protein NVSMB27_01430 [Ktedonobacteraceae bacterium]